MRRQSAGIPVFNAPFSNTRSVAELVIGDGCCYCAACRKPMLKRTVACGTNWRRVLLKRAGKKLGIIGYGHIGTQLGILAESLGMYVYFYDIENKLPLGNATQVQHLSDLLNMSDVVSLHVPENPSTKNMMGAKEISLMKPACCLINASRGTVVDIPRCVMRWRANIWRGRQSTYSRRNRRPIAIHLPLHCVNSTTSSSTPHIGGSTQEAQENIGLEVAGKLIKVF